MTIIISYLNRIEELQLHNDPFFPNGLLPSYRINPLLYYRRPDTNIFFSAISAFTLLHTVSSNQSTQIQTQIERIVNRIRACYVEFQNKDGLATYNFFKTKPSRHFPNGYFMSHFEHFRIPDDIDDTAMIYLTTERSREEVKWLKEKLIVHANTTKSIVRNTYPEYKSLKAYSTWFGKNMYIEFDCCVLANMLYCLYYYQQPLNDYDRDSLTYIRSVVETKRYLHEPFRCAHQYPRSPLIIYHLARLIGTFAPDELKSIKEPLIEGCYTLLKEDTPIMDKVILSSSLLRLGESAPSIDTTTITSEDFRGFYFFIAGLLTAYENPVLYRLAASKLFHIYWTCEAHCWVLLAEYEALKNSIKT